MSSWINSNEFYSEWHGHPIYQLEDVLQHMRDSEDKQHFIYLAGDSSLDNKYWISGFEEPAINGYQGVLRSQMMIPDVSYHINNILVKQDLDDYVCINTSVEATTLGDRSAELLAHDLFIQRHITEEDYLVVSVGGNDIALKPSIKTIANMGMLIYLTGENNIRNGTAWALSHFVNMFKDQVETYIKRILNGRRPKKVLVCMIYFPDEDYSEGSWADRSLGMLKYSTEPHRLQDAIMTIFNEATRKVEIDGVEVVPVPLFSVLNGKNTDDYVQRVEPSVSGGRKMAEQITKLLRLEEDETTEVMQIEEDQNTEVVRAQEKDQNTEVMQTQEKDQTTEAMQIEEDFQNPEFLRAQKERWQELQRNQDLPDQP